MEGAGSQPGLVRLGGLYSPNRGAPLFGVGSDSGPTGDWTNLDNDPPGNPVTPPLQQWACLEWMMDSDTDETRFYWDGVEHPSLRTSPGVQHGGNSNVMWDVPPITSVWLGWWFYQGNTANQSFDVWIDEVALDATRIGCVL